MMTYGAKLFLNLDPELLARVDAFVERERVRRRGQRLTRADVLRQFLTTGIDGAERWERERAKASA